MWVYGLDWAGPGQRQVADACECGNEPSGSVKCGEFLDQLQTSQLLKKVSAPWSKRVNKGKVIPLQAWCGPESEQTAALEGGEWSAAHPGRTLPPGKTRYPFYRKYIMMVP